MIDRAIIAFILVGILNTLFSYAVFALLLFCQLHYSLAVLLSTIMGVLFNFKTIGKLVFKSNDNSLIFRFVSVYVVVYLLNVVGLELYRHFDDNMYFGGFLLIFPSTIVSYMLHKTFVFANKSSRQVDSPGSSRSRK